MLQFSSFYKDTYEEFCQQSPNVSINEFVLFLESKREAIIKNDKWHKLLHKIDKAIFTKAIEYIDRDDFPDVKKQKIVNDLDKYNQSAGTYKKMFNAILPYIKTINQQKNRSCKILEIAGGVGSLAFSITEQAKKCALNVEVTCSDVVDKYIKTAEDKANKLNLPVQYKVIDALSMSNLPSWSYDIIVTLRSLHHFSPIQLAALFAGSQHVMSTVFVAMDIYRGLGKLLFISFVSFLQSIIKGHHMYFHDAWLSARKAYPQALLEAIASLACPNSTVEASHSSLGLTTLKIEKVKQVSFCKFSRLPQ